MKEIRDFKLAEQLEIDDLLLVDTQEGVRSAVIKQLAYVVSGEISNEQLEEIRMQLNEKVGKEEFVTSKRLANYTEIAEGADLNSDTYLSVGCYACSGSTKAGTLKNAPYNDREFYIEVSRFSNIVEQRFFSWGKPTVFRQGVIPFNGWYYNFTPLTWNKIGTPPANKLWGTDANGNVGWIDPPLAGRVTALESKSKHILSAKVEVSKNGWYLLCQFTNYYSDMIIMLHKGYNQSVSNGVVISFTNQHSNNAESAFNVLNQSGSGAIKKIAVVTYEGKTHLAINFSRTSTSVEVLSSLIIWNVAGSNVAYDDNFRYIGESPSSFSIVTEKTLSI